MIKFEYSLNWWMFVELGISGLQLEKFSKYLKMQSGRIKSLKKVIWLTKLNCILIILPRSYTYFQVSAAKFVKAQAP